MTAQIIIQKRSIFKQTFKKARSKIIVGNQKSAFPNPLFLIRSARF